MIGNSVFDVARYRLKPGRSSSSNENETKFVLKLLFEIWIRPLQISWKISPKSGSEKYASSRLQLTIAYIEAVILFMKENIRNNRCCTYCTNRNVCDHKTVLNKSIIRHLEVKAVLKKETEIE